MTVDGYVETVSEDRKQAFKTLRNVILTNIPEGFVETMNYGMPGYVVPHALYPEGYHCNPHDPLPFISIAVQKNAITLYHMGLYQDRDLLEWFRKEYSKTAKHKIDMGKSCVRFKYPDEIPFDLIGELVKKVDVAQWIHTYEKEIKGRKGQSDS